MTEEKASSRGPRSADEDRFYVAQAKHGVFQALGTDDLRSPFTSLAETFVLAAGVGFAFGRREPLGRRQHVGFLRTFDEQVGLPMLEAIAIAETGDPASVANRGQMLTIAEEYANSGIDILAGLDRRDRDRTVLAVASVLMGGALEPAPEEDTAAAVIDIEIGD